MIKNEVSVFEPDENTSEGDHSSKGGVKFFVASGDAMEGLEASEEVLDAVALAIEMLVKGRFCDLLEFTAMTATPPSWFT